MGISKQTTFKSFQPFFVHMTMPFSVIRGEKIPITVFVFNYMSSCSSVSVHIFFFIFEAHFVPDNDVHFTPIFNASNS